MDLDLNDAKVNRTVALTKDAGVKTLARWALQCLSLLLDNDKIAFAFGAAEGAFDVVSFKATEGLSTPFEVTIQLASTDPGIDLRQLLDRPASLAISQKHEADRPRYLTGIVAEAERLDRGERRTFYSVTLRPTIYRLSQLTDSHVWQQRSVAEIVSELLTECGIINTEWVLAEPHPPREYTTQYRENTLAFVERILAEEGIFYYFRHSAEDHTIVFTDAPLATPALEHASTIRYNAYHGPNGTADYAAFLNALPGGQGSVDVARLVANETGNGALVTGATNGLSLLSSTMHAIDTIAAVITRDSEVGTIGAFKQRERLMTNHVLLNDYDFTNPAAKLTQSSGAPEENATGSAYRHYDHPPRGTNAAHRIESVRVEATTGEGMGNNIHLCPGYRFRMADHDDPGANIEHFVVKTTHCGEQPNVLSEDAGSRPTTYLCSFETMPGRLPYRAPQKPKPGADGPQIAIVTGPAGQEIYCDEWGRVKVWFPWDLHGTPCETSSCWVRVSQGWAGAGYGQVSLPRIGNEVIVDYLDGDPDKPIIIGRTFHATNKPPYALPDHKTRMVIKSRSHMGQGSNELYFEDETEREEVYLHAERDLNIVVGDTHNLGVTTNQIVTVGEDLDEFIGQDRNSQVANDRVDRIGHNLEQSVGQDATYTVAQNVRETYGKDHIHKVGNIYKQSITGDHYYEVGGHFGGEISGFYSLTAHDTIATHAKCQLLMATEDFKISGPGGQIRITRTGIEIEAPEIILKGQVRMGGAPSPQVDALVKAANEALPICEECEAAEEGKTK